MTTVVDSLILEIGLDPAKLKAGTRESIDELRKFEAEAKKRGGNAETSVKGLEGAFAGLQKRLLGVAGLMLGGLGIEQMIQRITKLQVATANLGTTFGIQSQTFQRWGAAGERFGVPGNAIQQGLIGLQQQRFNLQNFGDPSGILSLSWGTRGTKNPLVAQGANGQLLDPERLALNISKWLQQAGPQGANALMRMGGLSQDFVTFLMQGPDKIKKVLEESKKLAPTDEEINRFKELNSAFEKASQLAQRLATIITAMASPTIIEALDNISKRLGTTMKTLKLISEGKYVDAAKNEMGYGPENQLSQKESRLKEVEAEILKQQGNKYGSTLYLQKEREDLVREIRKLRETIEKNGGGNPTVQQQSFTTSGDNVRVWKASLGGGGGIQFWSPPGIGGRGGSSPGYSASDDSVAAGIHGSAYLAAQRAGIKAEIDRNPSLREQLAGMMQLEGTPLQSMESLANRFAATNAYRKKQGLAPLTVEQMLHNGFYGPINRGQLPGAIAGLKRNPRMMQRMNELIDAVISGSNSILGATDQGMPSDPNGRHVGSDGFRLRKGGNVFNDWGGGGGHGWNEQWRRETQRRVQENEAASIPLPRPRPGSGVEELHTMLNSNRRFAGLGMSSSSNSVSVGNIHIYPPNGDPNTIAASIKPAIQRFARIASANNGPA